MKNSEIRKDYIQEKYVIISPKRQARPHDIKRAPVLTSATSAACVFCPQEITKHSVLLTTKKTAEPKEPWAVSG